MDIHDVLKIIENELSLRIEKKDVDKVAVTLMLSDKPIGKPITIEASHQWQRNFGPDGGSQVGGIRLDIA